jgi:hypothetical protein
MFALRQADMGAPVAEGWQKMGISKVTYYNWKKEYGNLNVPQYLRLPHLGPPGLPNDLLTARWQVGL